MPLTMEDINKRLTVVEDNTKEILGILKSSKDFNRKGLVETVQDHSDRLSLLELQKKIEKVKAGILGFLVGGVIVIIWFLIQQWFKQNIFKD